MPARDIRQRLISGEVLLLDGATGSELDRRGVNVSRGTAAGEPGVWSAAANIDAPDAVRQVHEDYLRLESRSRRVDVANHSTNPRLRRVCWRHWGWISSSRKAFQTSRRRC